MDVHRFVALFSSVVFAGSMVLAGDTIRDPNGKDSNGDCGETQGGENGDGGGDNSDPINLSTGDFQHHQTDLVIPGRGLNFEFKRYYRSNSGLQAVKAGQDGFATGPLIEADDHIPLGEHWDFNYNMRVSVKVPVFDPLIQDPGLSPDPLVPDEYLPAEIYVGSGK